MNIFSTAGHAPTDTEHRLFAEQPSSPRDVWTAIGQRIGLDALCIVLDEIDGAELLLRRPPTRRSYFARLWRPQRDEMIRRMHCEHVEPERIGTMVGLSRTGVLRVLGKQP